MNQPEDIELKKLIERLEDLEKPSLSVAQKEDLERVLMSKIAKPQKEYLPNGLERLVKALKRSAKETVMPVWASVMMKERILDHAVATKDFETSTDSRFGWFQPSMAALLLFFFATFAFVVSPWRAPVVNAKPTVLYDVDGEVTVMRSARLMQAEDGMEIFEGDRIFTEDGTVTIQFFDDSLSRLDEETDIEIRRMTTKPSNSLITEIEIFLDEGRLWTKVISILDESYFLVDTEDLKARADKKAAFDMHSVSQKTQVTVLDNVIDVTPKKGLQKTKKVVIAGYKAEAEDSVTVEKLPRQDVFVNQNEWIAANLEKDKTYETDLIEDKEEVKEEEPTLLADETVLANAKAEEVKQQFLDAFKSLIEAEESLLNGDDQAGREGLNNFKIAINLIVGSLPELEREDPFHANVVREFMNNKVALQLKDFAPFKPGNRLYEAKATLQEIELMLAHTDVKKAQVHLRQAEDVLFELEEMVNLNEIHLASTLLIRYQNRANGFSLVLTPNNVDEFNANFADLVQKQADQMQLLTAIENAIVYRDHDAFKEKVRKVRGDVLRKFVIALEQFPLALPEETVYEVKDLYDTYVGDTGTEGDLVAQALEKMLTRKQKLSFINPDGVPTGGEPGVVVLYSVEATAEVREEVVPDGFTSL